MLITRDATEAASILTSRTGSVIAYPTETFYGLGSRIGDKEGVIRIVSAKGRDSAKGMIILASDMDEVHAVAEVDNRQKALLQRFWPGALSVLLYAKKIHDPLLAPHGKIAVRISPHPLALALIKMTGPITSTSANPTGMPPATTAEEVAAWRLDIDGILDGGKSPGGNPSTLIDLTSWPPICLREGAIPFRSISEASR